MWAWFLWLWLSGLLPTRWRPHPFPDAPEVARWEYAYSCARCWWLRAELSFPNRRIFLASWSPASWRVANNRLCARSFLTGDKVTDYLLRIRIRAAWFICLHVLLSVLFLHNWWKMNALSFFCLLLQKQKNYRLWTTSYVKWRYTIRFRTIRWTSWKAILGGKYSLPRR